jgi:peptidoglycan/xylan/chitin deacetylase (PgdA/CDA1 family)
MAGRATIFPPPAVPRWLARARWPVLVACLGKLVALILFHNHPVAGLTLFFGAGGVVIYHLFVPSAQGLGPVVTRFATRNREVWLTIDDGPDPVDTPRILELLAQHDARASFFCIGECAARYPELVAAIVRAGHQVHHHTHTHPLVGFWCASPGDVAAEIDDGLEALELAGAEPRYFRGPVGIKNLFLHAALEERGLRYVGWSVRSRDCISSSPGAVAERVMRRLTPGDIILMHEGSSVPGAVRIQAIGALLERLTGAGFRCVNPPDSSLR